MLDVRAPVEFARGAFPDSSNLPLLDDAQREHIGIVYKQSGQDAAIATGERMATATIRQQRIDAWRAYARQHPDAVLYCFRGGLRSRISQGWLHEAGIDMPMVAGGYKMLRGYLLDLLQTLPSTLPFVVISGRTGVGKTDFLQGVANALDLEQIARHRGSSFGAALDGEQPTVINFENTIAVELLRRRANARLPIIVEDEGRLIGRLRLPPTLEQAMRKAPRLQLDSPLQERIRRIRHDYVVSAWQWLRRADPDHAEARLQVAIFDNLKRIRRRLGGALYAHIDAMWRDAFALLISTDDAGGFDEGIGLLLQQYYDPMYDYQQSQLQVAAEFAGDAAALYEYLLGQDFLNRYR